MTADPAAARVEHPELGDVVDGVDCFHCRLKIADWQDQEAVDSGQKAAGKTLRTPNFTEEAER